MLPPCGVGEAWVIIPSEQEQEMRVKVDNIIRKKEKK
jgi:hypothetical protein